MGKAWCSSRVRKLEGESGLRGYSLEPGMGVSSGRGLSWALPAVSKGSSNVTADRAEGSCRLPLLLELFAWILLVGRGRCLISQGPVS